MSTEWAEGFGGGRKNLYIIGIVVGVVLLGAVIFVMTRPGGTDGGGGGGGGGTTDTSKYAFETSRQGWVARTSWPGSMAITAVTQTTSQAKLGSGAIQCTVDLIPGDAAKSQGEAMVDMKSGSGRPTGDTVPVNMDGKTVSVWVYVPIELVTTPSNGLQIFLKDNDYDSWYSNWVNIETGDDWTQLVYTVPTDGTVYLYTVNGVPMSDGVFIPSQIVEAGVKIGANDQPGGQPFPGIILIDAFTW